MVAHGFELNQHKVAKWALTMQDAAYPEGVPATVRDETGKKRVNSEEISAAAGLVTYSNYQAAQMETFWHRHWFWE